MQEAHAAARRAATQKVDAHPFNSLLASRDPNSSLSSDEFGQQLSMVVSSLIRWSEHDTSMRNESGIVTRERAIQRLTQELEGWRDGAPEQLKSDAAFKPEVLRSVISDLQQRGSPQDDLATLVQEFSMQYPEFEMDEADFAAMGSLMSLGSMEMGSLRSALPGTK